MRTSAGLLMYRRSRHAGEEQAGRLHHNQEGQAGRLHHNQEGQAGRLHHNLELEVLLVHPGGPFFTNKDAGVWTIPKGEPAEGEELLETARREFREETGIDAGDAPLVPLGQVKQKGGKVVHAWAFEGDCDPATLTCNTFKVQWPPKSGQWRTFPEVDQYAMLDLRAAREKINPAQAEFLDRLEAVLAAED